MSGYDLVNPLPDWPPSGGQQQAALVPGTRVCVTRVNGDLPLVGTVIEVNPTFLTLYVTAAGPVAEMARPLREAEWRCIPWHAITDVRLVQA